MSNANDDAARAVDADGTADARYDRSLDGELDRTQMRECIMRVVEQLPASQRAVILLGELRGLSDREMADALGISLGATKIRLHRARRALKAELERACTFERDEENEFACAPKVDSLTRRRKIEPERILPLGQMANGFSVDGLLARHRRGARPRPNRRWFQPGRGSDEPQRFRQG